MKGYGVSVGNICCVVAGPAGTLTFLQVTDSASGGAVGVGLVVGCLDWFTFLVVGATATVWC